VGEPGSSPANKTAAPMKVSSQVAVTNLNAALLDGNHPSHFAAAYKLTVVVSPVGTDTENDRCLSESAPSHPSAYRAKSAPANRARADS
jgi:hypothetical protein